ncbi:MAG: TonB-dependent receptor plug domain-containing protein [Bacteroidales bacterium]|nr:TonB-dependent receptor plug domain-containing protein [Bacteroidales bacterium]
MRYPNRNSGPNSLYFRHFSRKNYAAFISMHRVVHILTLAFCCSLIVSPIHVAAQSDTAEISKNIDLEEVEVTGELSPVLSMALPRLVNVITNEESDCSPGHSLTDLLRYAANVDIRQRGKGGVQTDLSIRGGSFDHSLVLINGISISDPQTGHLSLNLPFETDAVHRIEILNGSAAGIYGAQALTGAVNFITRPSSINSVKISSSAGQYGYINNSITMNLGRPGFKNLFHYNNAVSSGYTLNTDYFRQGFFYQAQIAPGEDMLDLQVGHNFRSFGANGFYTPKYPDQFEVNSLWFAALSYTTRVKGIKLIPYIYWRRHRDRWEMFRVDEKWYRVADGLSISNNPEATHYDTAFVYTNHHLTDMAGARLDLKKDFSFGSTRLGAHLHSERILSTAIGSENADPVPIRAYDELFYGFSDKRTNFDLYVQQSLHFKGLYLSGGTMLNWNSYIPRKVNFFPGIDLRFRVLPFVDLLGSYSYNQGLPTFTDLTYRDPSNEGNSTLQPYSQHSLESGIRLFNQGLYASALVFASWGRDVIDWVWFADQYKFRPVNVDHYSSRGLEISARYDAKSGSTIGRFSKHIQVGYTFLDMDKQVPGDIIKYQNVRHKFNLMADAEPIRNLIVALTMSYTVREGSYLEYSFEDEAYSFSPYKPYFLMDFRLSYQYRYMSFFVDVTNLLDASYIDVGSITQPGRWTTAGIKFRFSYSRKKISV